MPLPFYKIFVPALAFLAAAIPFETTPALADKAEKRTISLSAEGVVKATPDKVDITTGVTSEGQTAQDALAKNSEAMSKVVDGLKDAGIDKKDIQTTDFSVSPIYEQKRQGQAAFITGYRVSNRVHIVVRDPKKLGEIMDTVVRLGANQIGSIRFGVSEPEALKDEARKLAMRNAEQNAKLYAQTAGVELGPVITITEENGGYMPRHAAAASMEMAKADVPIEAGTTMIQARIRVTWELR